MRSRRSTRLSSAIALIIVVAGCAKRAPATTPRLDPVSQLRTDISSLVDRPGIRRGTWGIAVQSLDRDERLYELNARSLLVPASTMKLVSVATAAEAVGWDFSFETPLLATGPIEQGVLRGDLVIAGSGDPSVFGRPLDVAAASAWIEALRARGITRIEGRIIGDDNGGEEPRPGFAWSWDDLGYDYGAIAGALNFGENAVQVNVVPGPLPGSATMLQLPFEAADLPIVNRSTTAAAGTRPLVWPEQRPGETQLTVAGMIPVGPDPARLSIAVGNPTLWFARRVRARLIASGIDVAGDAVDIDDLAAAPDPSTATLVYTHRSHPLREVVVPLLKESINVYAEAVLRLVTGPGGTRTNDAAIEAARRRLEAWGIAPDGIQMVDGSGLSRRDVIAPETLLAVLRRMYDPSWSSPFMSGLPVAGRDGTLRARMKGTPAEGNAIAKTGSMSNIRTLAGYVRTCDGEALAFAVMVNNFEGPAADALAAIDAIVVRLASFSREQPFSPRKSQP